MDKGNGRQYIGNRYWAKRATDYMLGACNLVCMVRRQIVENVEGKCCEAKRVKGVLITNCMGITKWRRKLHETKQFRWQVEVKSGEEGNNICTE